MKKLLSIALLQLLSPLAFSQDFQNEAILSKSNGENFRGWILAATKSGIRFKTAPTATNFTDGKIRDYDSIFLMEPPEYSAAMDLYEARKYKEARAAFAALKDKSTSVSTLRDNHHTLSAFYEMESMRKLGDLDALAIAFATFAKEPLTREYQIRQLDLYALWNAIHLKDWDRALLLASERDMENLPGDQRTQVAYSKGLALQNLDRGSEALLAYNTAITADAGASETVASKAALNALEIYNSDPEVQLAIKNWGTKDENKNSGGYARLLEAAALANFYKSSLAPDKKLPAGFEALLKFQAA